MLALLGLGDARALHVSSWLARCVAFCFVLTSEYSVGRAARLSFSRCGAAMPLHLVFSRRELLDSWRVCLSFLLARGLNVVGVSVGSSKLFSSAIAFVKPLCCYYKVAALMLMAPALTKAGSVVNAMSVRSRRAVELSCVRAKLFTAVKLSASALATLATLAVR